MTHAPKFDVHIERAQGSGLAGRPVYKAISFKDPITPHRLTRIVFSYRAGRKSKGAPERYDLTHVTFSVADEQQIPSLRNFLHTEGLENEETRGLGVQITSLDPDKITILKKIFHEFDLEDIVGYLDPYQEDLPRCPYCGGTVPKFE